MEFQRVDKKAKTKWRFSRIIALIFAVIPLAVLLLIAFSAIAEDEGSETLMIIGWAVAGLLVLAQIVSIVVYPPIEYIQWAYLIAPDRIEIKKGIFYRTHTVIPISRIQHVAVTQGVLQRPFKLSTVQIHTAGDVMEIQELGTDVAEEICARLQKRVNVKVEQKNAAQAQSDSQAGSEV
ncbi:MAG: PH domain-containing protein [Clostridia bacterium]|nr:PH domain-containing protein [Clostridia bacterium]